MTALLLSGPFEREENVRLSCTAVQDITPFAWTETTDHSNTYLYDKFEQLGTGRGGARVLRVPMLHICLFGVCFSVRIRHRGSYSMVNLELTCNFLSPLLPPCSVLDTHSFQIACTSTVRRNVLLYDPPIV